MKINTKFNIGEKVKTNISNDLKKKYRGKNCYINNIIPLVSGGIVYVVKFSDGKCLPIQEKYLI